MILFQLFDVAKTNDHSQEDLAIHESRKFKKILITYRTCSRKNQNLVN
jgi:hypothetical protein